MSACCLQHLQVPTAYWHVDLQSKGMTGGVAPIALILVQKTQKQKS